WKCAKGHEWEAQVSPRTRGNGCPECVNQKVGKDNNLAVLRPDLLVDWDPEENGKLTPNDVTIGSNRKVSWKCKKGHKWRTSVSHKNRGSRCPTCFPRTKNTSNVGKIVPKKKGYNTLPHYLYKEWHPIKNGLFNLENISLFSNKRGWWRCEKGHEWKALISTRSKGHGCPECTNHKVGIDNNLAVMKPDLADEWHPTKNGELTPFEVVPGSGQKVWWKCHKDHEWETLISNRSTGKGCPECVNQKAGKD
ncbi:zinc-ribbon domain-containing protein, partial [Candidatus Paracaedibacter symbiosus]|uniref:zinc-ribbon domain-containing protein n=1 Tax=Candidatus Paracaedibacter symbiosus TaxID=244582 RepID=UPI0018DC96E2